MTVMPGHHDVARSHLVHSLPLNPIDACVPSQYGLFALWPQRHSAYCSCAGYV